MRSQHTAHDGQPSAPASPTTGQGLFSHPDLVVADSRAGTSPAAQWSHASLFQEAATR
ncbi:hypothetical protein ACFWNN_09210 [Lentzea sp. NPDC058450]|uniref:hypothetical protein n=1 Tax=Lentzea sp. NPDC058450 TaxID=3346505 RepID=UPI00365B4785